MNKIKELYYDIVNGIQAVWRWIPIIWKDRDWDYSYAEIILMHKTRMIKEYIDSRKFYIGYERDVQRMQLVESLLDKVSTNYYENEMFKYYDVDFHLEDIEETTSDVDEFKSLTMDITKNDIPEYIEKNKGKVERAKKVLENKFDDYDDDTYIRVIANTIANLKHKQAKRIAFTIIQRHSDEWWD